MKIKTTPDDFCVDELIEPPITGNGEYTYFWLTKTNWTTQRAIDEMARRLRVSRTRLRFAGTKDKHAITKQVICIWKVEPEQLNQINLKDIQIDVIGKSDVQLTLGNLIGNRFKITVRDLSAKELAALKKNSKTIAKGVLNLFGPQRFGRGNTHLIGKQILIGNIEEAVKLILAYGSDDETDAAKTARQFANENWGDWKAILDKMPAFLGIEKSILNQLIKVPTDFAGAMRTTPKLIRKMYIHAYQSWLWNNALITTKAKGELKVPGYDTKLGRTKFENEIKKMLKSEGITLANFSCSRMPELKSAGNLRDGIVKPTNFSYELDGSTAILHFDLPKSCYATVLLEQLFI